MSRGRSVQRARKTLWKEKRKCLSRANLRKQSGERGSCRQVCSRSADQPGSVQTKGVGRERAVRLGKRRALTFVHRFHPPAFD